MQWIDYKKAYKVPQSWIIDNLRKYKISGETKIIFRKLQRKLESRTDSGKKKLNRGEDPKRDLPGRSSITITICNCDNVT